MPIGWQPVPTVATGDLWTAAQHNTYIKNNQLALARAIDSKEAFLSRTARFGHPLASPVTPKYRRIAVFTITAQWGEVGLWGYWTLLSNIGETQRPVIQYRIAVQQNTEMGEPPTNIRAVVTSPVVVNDIWLAYLIKDVSPEQTLVEIYIGTTKEYGIVSVWAAWDSSESTQHTVVVDDSESSTWVERPDGIVDVPVLPTIPGLVVLEQKDLETDEESVSFSVNENANMATKLRLMIVGKTDFDGASFDSAVIQINNVTTGYTTVYWNQAASGTSSVTSGHVVNTGANGKDGISYAEFIMAPDAVLFHGSAYVHTVRVAQYSGTNAVTPPISSIIVKPLSGTVWKAGTRFVLYRVSTLSHSNV